MTDELVIFTMGSPPNAEVTTLREVTTLALSMIGQMIWIPGLSTLSNFPSRSTTRVSDCGIIFIPRRM